MEVQMQNSLPARPSLEQLKKLAKDLVKDHQDKQPDALALIARHLPALSGKSADDIVAYPFALHDAQSVVARQYGFPSWNELSDYIEKIQKADPAPQPDLDVAAKLRTILKSYQQNDYALYCSVMSEQMKAYVTRERFDGVCNRMAAFMKSAYETTYMGTVNRTGHPIHFWRMWVKGWETDLLVRMALNNSGLVSGLLFSDPFDTAINAKK